MTQISSANFLESVVTAVELSKASPEIVRATQTELVRLKYLPGAREIDGIPGPRTMAAFRQFKRDNHLGEIDFLGPTTVKHLLDAAPKLLSNKSDHIRLIVAECKRQRVDDERQIAYLLATTQHETAGTYRPIDEIGAVSYFLRYERRSDLGNIHPGDGARFKGRGYVQITGRRNYTLYAGLIGEDLVRQPERVKEPTVAAFILVHGSRTGTFTGRKLSDYINSTRCDFINARRIINGLDRAELIASYAHGWLKALSNYA